MPGSNDTSDARERVLRAAEKLFSERGYNAVTLRDIAAEVGIRHTSLYYHVPGGKEALYIEVTERNLQHHHTGLTESIAGAESNVRSQLHAIADWLLSQPPMDLIRMSHSDMPSVDKQQARRLMEQTFEAMLRPIEQVLEQAQQRGEVEHHDLGVIAGGILGMVEGFHAIPDYALDKERQLLAYELIDAMLNGIRKR
ncbi:MAG: TetR/AcrR family transcriptional regulator [Chloroflexota bacterium]